MPLNLSDLPWPELPEPHCRVCAAQMADGWVEFEGGTYTHDSQTFDQLAEYQKIIAGPLMTTFGRDESHAREANEFGY